MQLRLDKLNGKGRACQPQRCLEGLIGPNAPQVALGQGTLQSLAKDQGRHQLPTQIRYRFHIVYSEYLALGEWHSELSRLAIYGTSCLPASRLSVDMVCGPSRLPGCIESYRTSLLVSFLLQGSCRPCFLSFRLESLSTQRPGQGPCTSRPERPATRRSRCCSRPGKGRPFPRSLRSSPSPRLPQTWSAST